MIKFFNVKIKRLGPIILTLTIFGLGVTLAYQKLKPTLKERKRLPVYNPVDINPALVDPSVQNVYKQHRVGDFKLIDQMGNTVTPENFKGKIYVTDFFFTTYGTICPKMTKQMVRVYDEFKDNPEVMILSHTVTPEIDSVEVLRAYAENLGVKDDSKWIFVTGDKKQIYNLARKVYFAATTEGDGGANDFVHTENFVLVDKEKRLRGFYDGTSKDDVDRLIDDIYTLLDEYKTENNEE
ncbi:MAG TPA: SCO family protein [Flavobacteriales bacterium]|nr:SCO family protein [Flavobacteriales bacterium]